MVISCTNSYNPWLTQGILKSINHENKLYKCYIKNPNHINKDKYTIFRNKFTHIIQKSKKEVITLTASSDHQAWHVLSRALGRDKEDLVLPDAKDLANQFNSHFVSI